MAAAPEGCATMQLINLPAECLHGILSHLPWQDLCCTLPLANKHLASEAAVVASKVQLNVVLQRNDHKLHSKVSCLQSRATRLVSLQISWAANQHQEQLQLLPVLQALTVPAGARLPPQLQQLVLHVELDAEGAVLRKLAALLAGTPQLRHLELRPVREDAAICRSLDSAEVAATFTVLLSTPTLTGLSTLAFHSLPPALALSLVQHSNLQQLSSLQLRNVRWLDAFDFLSTASGAARAIADQFLGAVRNNMRRLRQLDLSHTRQMRASPEAFAQLAAALQELTALDISQCADLCAAAPGQESLLLSFQHLRAIHVSGTTGKFVQASMLAQLTALTHIACNRNPAVLGLHNGHNLPDLTGLRQLCELELSGCWLVGSQAATAALPQLQSLTRLDLSNNPLELETIAALGRCARLADLNLSMTRNSCQPQSRCGATANEVAASTAWRAALEYERQPGVAVEAWRQLSSLTQLTTLDVRRRGHYRSFSTSLLVPLAKACGSRLRVLLLDFAVKQPGELAVLLRSCSGLKTLDISYSSCKFDADDLAALAGLTQLQTLQLQRCKPVLRDEVVPVLLQLRSLRLLDLEENDLSRAGTRALLAGLAGPGCCLTELRMGGNFDVTGPERVELAREFPMLH